jgi:adenylate cyclase class 2
MQTLEKEIKIEIRDENEISKILNYFNPTFIKEYEQIDYYYDLPTHDLFLRDEVLRIREENSKYYLSYKGEREGNDGKTREEITVEISNPIVMEEILTKLNFKKTLVIKKKRREYLLNKNKLYIDFVSNLGIFMEIEVDKKDDFRDIIDKLDEIGITRDRIIKETYAELLLLKT